jgi:hypothetical protein
MPISPSLRGLSQAIAGPQGYDPLDPTQQFDQRQQARYATEDADPNLNRGPGYPTSFSNAFNRSQDAGAVGPQGYNRPWVPFLQSIAGARVKGLQTAVGGQ